MQDDRQLLHNYTETGSEAAFGELVTRYVNLVYSAALRQTNGDTHLAQDVAQLVFADLARKARSLPSSTVLAGWLHRATRYAAMQMQRTERRRRAREQEAAIMNAVETGHAPDWEQIRPQLDEALDGLKRADRDALLLRFFQQRSFVEVGAALGTNEEAARKRVVRALEQLRVLLQKRGVALSAAALGTAMTAEAVSAAPTTLAAGITTAAIAGAGTIGTTTTLLKIMSMTKVKAGLAAAMVAGSVATSLIIQQNADAKMRTLDTTLTQQSEQIAGLEKAGERAIAPLATAPDQMDELQKLRAEAAALRTRTNELAKLRDENQRLRFSRPLPAQTAPSLQEQVAAREESIARLSHGKQLSLGVIQAAMENQDQVPTNFDAAMKHIGGPTAAETLVPDQFEIVYHGPLMQRDMDPSRRILIREKQSRKMPDGTWQRVYIHLDGSGIIHTEPDGNFDAYEAQGGIKPPPR